jgi:diaminobutyrate-2-oxoglutarate transaminase
MMRIFDQIESEVRSYVRAFPTIFSKAEGAILCDEQGKEYIDFFAGAGVLNYGHNNSRVNQALIAYLQENGIVHGLDQATSAKKRFLERFYYEIMQPRHMEYKVQFTGPTGTNAVETALKLARMVKGRSNVIAFTNGFHGLTMGSMAVTGNAYYRDESFINRSNVSFMPYDGYFGQDVNTAQYLRTFLSDQSSGVDLPAAIIMETVQAEGGVNVASSEWLVEVERICREYDILLIVDDIQVGNGRTGTFFSFEEAGISPDIITLSKSIGGGLPLALVLIRPDLDQWKPGEHTGTFRGNNLAFVAATQLFDYWQTDAFSEEIKAKEVIIRDRLLSIAEKYPELDCKVRGRGMIYGLEIGAKGMAQQISRECFNRNLIIELAGAKDQVLKFLPPLVIEEALLVKGLDIIEESIVALVAEKEQWRMGKESSDNSGS